MKRVIKNHELDTISKEELIRKIINENGLCVITKNNKPHSIVMSKTYKSEELSIICIRGFSRNNRFPYGIDGTLDNEDYEVLYFDTKKEGFKFLYDNLENYE